MNWTLLLQAEGTKGGGWTMWVMLLLIIVVFYFFMIRPQQKKQKQLQNFRDTLQKGDKVVTIGGVHGKINDIRENTFIIEISQGVTIEIDKAAINVDSKVDKKK